MGKFGLILWKNKYLQLNRRSTKNSKNTEFNTNIERVNGILNDIAKVNEKIQKFNTATNDLLDKRDLLELELSQYVDIKVNRIKIFMN